MKSNFWIRNYRARTPDLTTFQVVIEESDLWIAAHQDLSAMAATEVRRLRGQIQAWAELHPEFYSALTPLPCPQRAPAIVRRMYHAAEATGVGPMAAVAGAIAQAVAEALHRESPEVLVENGGDNYLISRTERVVGILDDPAAGMRLGLRLAPHDFPCALCASSARIGHSLSFGDADLVVVRAADAALADAAATALANRVHSPRHVERALALAQEWEQIGIDGVLIRCGEMLGAWGNLELAAVDIPQN
jgi:hypothetical protein